MVGALYSITSIVLSLVDDHDAPAVLGKKSKRGVALNAVLLNGLVIGVFVLVSYFLSNQVFEYFVTAASIMLILNWVNILSSHIKNRSLYNESKGYKMRFYPYSSYLGILLIVITIAGSLIQTDQRIGFFISIGFVVLIFCSYRIKRHVENLTK